MVNTSYEHNSIYVSARELRDIFNALEIARKGRDGTLERRIAWAGTRRPRHAPVGTRSRIWHYYLPHNGWRLAVAHVYIERGGRAIGQPDPKEIKIDELAIRPAQPGYEE